MNTRITTLRDDIALVIFDRELENLLRKSGDSNILALANNAWHGADKILAAQEQREEKAAGKKAWEAVQGDGGRGSDKRQRAADIEERYQLLVTEDPSIIETHEHEVLVAELFSAWRRDIGHYEMLCTAVAMLDPHARSQMEQVIADLGAK